MVEASFPSVGLLNIVLHFSLFSALFVLHYSLFTCSIYNLQSKYVEAIGFLLFFSWGGASSLNSSQLQLMSRCGQFHKQTKPSFFLFFQAVVTDFFLGHLVRSQEGLGTVHHSSPAAAMPPLLAEGSDCVQQQAENQAELWVPLSSFQQFCAAFPQILLLLFIMPWNCPPEDNLCLQRLKSIFRLQHAGGEAVGTGRQKCMDVFRIWRKESQRGWPFDWTWRWD